MDFKQILIIIVFDNMFKVDEETKINHSVLRDYGIDKDEVYELLERKCAENDVYNPIIGDNFSFRYEYNSRYNTFSFKAIRLEGYKFNLYYDCKDDIFRVAL